MQYHKSGRHFVRFVLHGEGLWLNLQTSTFHIIERGAEDRILSSGDIESKEDSDCDEFVFMEELSLDFAFAQSGRASSPE